MLLVAWVAGDEVLSSKTNLLPRKSRYTFDILSLSLEEYTLLYQTRLFHCGLVVLNSCSFNYLGGSLGLWEESTYLLLKGSILEFGVLVASA